MLDSFFHILSVCTLSLHHCPQLLFIDHGKKSMALASVECCGQVGRTLHIQGVSGSNYDSETGHSDRFTVVVLSSLKQMLTFGRKTFFHTYSNFLFTNHLTIQR
jgi:hypothetical protein